MASIVDFTQRDIRMVYIFQRWKGNGRCYHNNPVRYPPGPHRQPPGMMYKKFSTNHKYFSIRLSDIIPLLNLAHPLISTFRPIRKVLRMHRWSENRSETIKSLLTLNEHANEQVLSQNSVRNRKKCFTVWVHISLDYIPVPFTPTLTRSAEVWL